MHCVIILQVVNGGKVYQSDPKKNNQPYRQTNGEGRAVTHPNPINERSSSVLKRV